VPLGRRGEIWPADYADRESSGNAARVAGSSRFARSERNGQVPDRDRISAREGTIAEVISAQRSPFDDRRGTTRNVARSLAMRASSRQPLQSRNRHSADHHHRTESSCPEDSVLTDDGTCKCVPTCPPPKCRPGQRPIQVRPAKPETPGSCCPLHDCRPPGNYERS